MSWATVLLLLCVIVGTATLARTGLLAVVVVGRSMEPTLRAGDVVLAVKWWPRHWLVRGAVVLIRGYGGAEGGPNALMIKRVCGIGGDRVRLGEDFNKDLSEVVLDHDQVFVLSDLDICSGPLATTGDRKARPIDSRTWGPIPAASIDGWVVVTLPIASRLKSQTGSRTGILGL